MKATSLSPTLLLCAALVLSLEADNDPHPKRFFSDDSFWNQPIPADAEVDPRSDFWISLLKQDSYGNNFGPNVGGYTTPIYEVDADTPRHTVLEREFTDEEWAVVGFEGGWFDRGEIFHHGPGFGQDVPIPDHARPDPESDAHFALVDYATGIVWDMWGATYRDGQWRSYTGMKYKLKGDGVFDEHRFVIKTGESIHHYGPGTAAGIPVIAGVIRYDDVKRGRIEHKLSGAVRYAALQEFVYPAIWTDGIYAGGIPQGAVIQLDPNLDLTEFDLNSYETAVAVAMQEYGIVIRDLALGNVLYPEGLFNHPGKSWEGVLRGWDEPGGIKTIPLDHYRVLRVGPTTKGGDNDRPDFHRVF